SLSSAESPICSVISASLAPSQAARSSKTAPVSNIDLNFITHCPNFSINSLSFHTVIPSEFAFSSLLPASSPATTTSVFLDTLPVTFPPYDSMLFFASPRVISTSLPVNTNVMPENTVPDNSSFSSVILSPAASSLLTSSIKSSLCVYVTIESAIL